MQATGNTTKHDRTKAQKLVLVMASICFIFFKALSAAVRTAYYHQIFLTSKK